MSVLIMSGKVKEIGWWIRTGDDCWGLLGFREVGGGWLKLDEAGSDDSTSPIPRAVLGKCENFKISKYKTIRDPTSKTNIVHWTVLLTS